jgi:hypothetical protein
MLDQAHLRNEGRGKGHGEASRRQMLQEASKMEERPELGQQHRAQKDAEIAVFNAEVFCLKYKRFKI